MGTSQSGKVITRVRVFCCVKGAYIIDELA